MSERRRHLRRLQLAGSVKKLSGFEHLKLSRQSRGIAAHLWKYQKLGMGHREAQRRATIIRTKCRNDIHPQGIMSGRLPSSIRAAVRICSAFSMINSSDKSMIFRSLESQADQLFQPVQTGTFLEALSNLQALVSY